MYLIFQYSPLRETMFQGVFKLEPGSYMTYDGNLLVINKYFEPVYNKQSRGSEMSKAMLRKTLQDSVIHHQVSDVEVGALLSGGVDSGYITALARPKKTYSVGFDVPGFDETAHAKKLCDALHISNKRKEITPDEFFQAVPRVQYQSDEPHANLSAVPLYYLAELAAKDVKVVLSGEGGGCVKSDVQGT